MTKQEKEAFTRGFKAGSEGSKALTGELLKSIQEAWRIINVFHMNSIDEGESWDRAAYWLKFNENFKPKNLDNKEVVD